MIGQPTPASRNPIPTLAERFPLSLLTTGKRRATFSPPAVGTAWMLGGLSLSITTNDAIPTASAQAFELLLNGDVIDRFDGLNSNPNILPNTIFHSYQPGFVIFDMSKLELRGNGADILPATAFVNVWGNVGYL